MQLFMFLGILTLLNVGTFLMATENVEAEGDAEPIPHVITVTPVE